MERLMVWLLVYAKLGMSYLEFRQMESETEFEYKNEKNSKKLLQKTCESDT